jgi:sterol desaturase/sphingolipid hydroxylase (fatty acid hydroxylase superfamily)
VNIDTTLVVFFGACFIVFLPLERLYAIHRQKVIRPEYFTDVLFYAGQYILWNGLVVYLLSWIARGVDLLPLESLRAWRAGLPFALQVFLVVVLCDLGIYWGHRLQHRSTFLWRFHRVHHTAEHLDWVAAYREHPLDNLYTRLIESLPAIVLGFPLAAIAGLIMFRGLWGLFIHSNAEVPIGPLKYILGSPRLHHWHHAIGAGNDCNYGNLMPVMDVIFGTYHEPPAMPERYGIEARHAHNYLAQMITPLLPTSFEQKLMNWRLPAPAPEASEAGRR